MILLFSEPSNTSSIEMEEMSDFNDDLKFTKNAFVRQEFHCTKKEVCMLTPDYAYRLCAKNSSASSNVVNIVFPMVSGKAKQLTLAIKESTPKIVCGNKKCDIFS